MPDEELEPPPPPPDELLDEPPPPPPPPEELLDDPPPPDELLDELPPPPPEELLDEPALELDDPALDELEAVLLLELVEPLPSGEDDVLEPDPLSGPVGLVPQPTPNMPTPARATPPDSMRRNCRRSSRRVASSPGLGFTDSVITTSLHPLLSKRRARG